VGLGVLGTNLLTDSAGSVYSAGSESGTARRKPKGNIIMGYAGEVEWMNQEGNALMGFLDNRAMWEKNGYVHMQKDGTMKAWWASEDFKGGYAGAIPVEDVQRRMLNWEAQESDIAVKVYVTEGDYDDQDSNGYFKWVADPDHKAIVRTDNKAIFNYVGRDTYQVHGYDPVIQQCANIADGELGIASAFLMDQGAVFVINMELPDDITTETGIAHRVRLQASTSMNSKFATQWKIVDEFSVCSNSFSLNLAGKGNEFRVKHTSKSLGRIGDARQALGLVYKAAEEYTAFLDSMTKVDVNDAQFKAILEGIFVLPDPEVKNGKVCNLAAITRTENKRDTLLTMWGKDKTVSPWAGTLFGAFQAWSTWNQHERPRGDALAANIIGSVNGSIAKADSDFFAIVAGLENLDLGALVPA
jgi:phage/plasmid-like protein (TIGR03299 family)